MSLLPRNVLKDIRRKLSRRDVRREMEPLAACEEGADSPRDYGGTHYQFPEDTPQLQSDDEDQLDNHGETRKSSSQSNSNAEIGEAARRSTTPQPTDLPLSPTDDTDFSVKASLHSNTKEKRKQNRPSLKITAIAQSPVLGSPDSDRDILGYLDYTPDPLPDNNDSVIVSRRLVVSLEHGDYKWTVRKKVRQVTSLHSVLMLLRTRLKMPAATRGTRLRRQSMRQQIKQADRNVDSTDGVNPLPNKRLLKFPRRALQTMDESVRADLEIYLKNLLHHSLFRSHQAVLEFFEVSSVSFVSGLGTKIKEGYVKKRTGSNSDNGCCTWCFAPCTRKYKQRWLVLKETCLFFLSPETGQVRTVMLMDSGFQVAYNNRLTGARNLRISNHSRYVDGARYMWDVADMLEAAKEEIFITDWWMSPQIYLKRPDITGCKWSGVRVFILLYKEVELALGISSLHSKQTVNQLHPNIKVLRHPDHMAGGVLYWAHHEKLVIIDQMYAFVSGIDLAFGRWDDYRHKLEDTGHGGVHVSQSPQGFLGGALQHLVRGTNEVLVNTMTQSTPSSRRTSLDASTCADTTFSTDISSLHLNPNELESPPRRDETRKRDIVENPPLVCDPGDDTVDHREIGETKLNIDETKAKYPDSNIKNGDSVQVSSVVETIALQPCSKRSHARTRFFKRDPKLVKESSNAGEVSSDDEYREGKVGKSIRDVKRLGMDLVEEVKEKGREVRAWTAHKLPQLHRRNSSDSDISDSSSDERENVEISRNRFYRRRKHKLNFRNRLESCSSLAQAHNVVTMEDSTSTHLWVGKDYVNWISKDLDNLDEPFKDSVDRHQTPRMPWHDIGLFVEGPAARDAARHFIERWNAIKTEKAKPNPNYPYLLPRSYDKKNFVPSNLHPKHKVKCQFFITCSNDNAHMEVMNCIGHEIVNRIVQAHEKGEVFRVYIMLPLLPAFEGMIGKSSGIAMQYIVYWNYVSICRGKSSVIHCLEERGVTEWQRYVSFCSLRTHENLGDRPVSELVYIHSKLMIVDDRYVIAGSANINDRSLNGNRDSEVCLVIKDQEFEDGVMNGNHYDAGMFAGSMRKYLFSEHLGVVDSETPSIDVSDPISDTFFIDIWQSIASKNALIYEEVFSCYPCNSAKTFEDVDKLRSATTLAEVNPTEAQARLKEIQGHLVQFPLDFLKDEVLKPGGWNKESLLPTETWT
ncbi:Phospholipase D2-like [Homarus americanus]|uniref:Phospholipase n=1 Tax=Homarus americanus TaxID=6706 RepID=A0A8J5N4C7_HOMAM|nr:Phospholipase D2-like [Homarus americanus]